MYLFFWEIKYESAKIVISKKGDYYFSHFLFIRYESGSMKIEKITYKNRKIDKRIKSNGNISYSLKGAYLGIDNKTGKQVTTTVTARTLRELDRKFLKAKLDFEKNGSTKGEQLQVILFKDLAEVWFNSFQTLVSSENTLNRVSSYLSVYIIPHFGHLKLNKIKAIDIQLWVNELAINAKKTAELGKKKSDKGSTKEFGAIVRKVSDIFDFGVTNFGLEVNPVKHIIIPPKPKSNAKRIVVLHDDDLLKWLRHLDSLPNNRANRRFKVICETLLYSALRVNELLALEYNDLDFENCEILVSKTLMWKNANKKIGMKGQVICKTTPKTASGYRRVSVPLEILQSLKAFFDEMNEYFRKHNLAETNLIFPTIYGNYMCDRNERTTLKSRLKSLGLPDYGFHIFRHTHASIMLNAGANWKELQIRMGHKSISTTMDLYAELAPQKRSEAVNVFMNKISELTG